MSHAQSTDSTAIELLVGRISDEFAGKFTHGERPRIEDYVAQYPQIAEILRRVLPAIEAMCQLSEDGRLTPIDASPIDDPSLSGLNRLGDFRILQEIGRGGMGVVYEAEQISLRRRVALKVLPYAAILDPRHLARFRNETLAAAALKHPNIVSVYFVGCERSVHFYAMELVDGPSLAEVVRQLHSEPSSSEPSWSDPSSSKPRATHSEETAPIAALSTNSNASGTDFFQRVAELGVQAADALEYAHQMGIVHRDIKPSNLLIDARGNLFVTDFGLAQVGEESSKLTVSGDILGTLRYMSPEQATGNRRILDHRTDIYSLGITLYELLTGKHAFCGSNRQKLLREITERAPRLPRSVNSNIPRDLETIVLKAVTKEPKARYATMSELADDLRRFLHGEPIHARRVGPTGRLVCWCRRNRLVASLLVGLGLMVCATGYAMVQAWLSPPAVYPSGSGIASRLVASGTIDHEGGVSPGGAYLSHINWTYGNVAVIDLESGQSRDVTSDGTWEPGKGRCAENAVWSPDGQQIAYAWSLDGTKGLEAKELRIINRDGSGQRTVYRNEDLLLLWLESWSADGRYILVKQIRRDGSNQLALIATDDGAEQILFSASDIIDVSPTLSPDGAYVVYSARRADPNALRNLYILNTRTPAPLPLVTNRADNWFPLWTPDGRWIVFLSDRRGNTALWGLRMTDGHAVGTPYLIKKEMAGISPLGMTRAGSFYYHISASRSDLYTARIDFQTLTLTSPVTVLETDYEGINLIGSWSAGGKLAYVSRGARNREPLRLTITDPETGRRQITLSQRATGSNGVLEMRWAPGEEAIILGGRSWNPDYSFVKVDVRTGQIDPYWPQILNLTVKPLTWSPDGRFVYFAQDNAIFRLEVATNRQLRLLEGPYGANLTISPDGEQLAFLKNDETVCVMPATGRQLQEVFKPEARDSIARWTLAWLPDGHALIVGTCASGDFAGPVRLWHVPLSHEEEPHELPIQMTHICHVRVHPDGKQIMFRSRRGQAEVWAIDNVLATLNSTE